MYIHTPARCPHGNETCQPIAIGHACNAALGIAPCQTNYVTYSLMTTECGSNAPLLQCHCGLPSGSPHLHM